jgi:hypothetical protein
MEMLVQGDDGGLSTTLAVILVQRGHAAFRLHPEQRMRAIS